MRFIAILLASMAAMVAAAPAPSDFDIVARADIDCGSCTDMYNFCITNGHTNGQEGCLKTCREHVCHRNPECKGCGGDVFSLCPAQSRYPH